MSSLKESNINNKIDKSSSVISKGLFSIFTGKKIDDSILEELENLLISSDLGFNVTDKILTEIKKNKYNKLVNIEDIKNIIAKYIKTILLNSEKDLKVKENKKPYIMMFIGVNGVGKTTIIGKIAKNLREDGKKVLIGACDTFRAGAVEQLEKWANDSKVEIIKSEKEGADPSSIAYQATEKAKKENYDVLLLDTAGRMQNNVNLMSELEKISRVVKKVNETDIDENILVLDATTGQNTKKQVEIFNKKMNISGIIMNKMDGTSKGGILVSIYDEYKKPIYAIGVGEKIDDLQKFNVDDYVNNLLKIK